MKGALLRQQFGGLYSAFLAGSHHLISLLSYLTVFALEFKNILSKKIEFREYNEGIY